jgi:hypothetical protein
MSSRIEYVDSEELSLSFISLVINVEPINQNIGLIHEFCNANNLYGATNGKLLLVADMVYPSEELNNLSNLLEENGVAFEKDYLFLEEQLTEGVTRVKDHYPSPIGQKIPGTENCTWIASEIREDGNWVWKTESTQRVG